MYILHICLYKYICKRQTSIFDESADILSSHIPSPAWHKVGLHYRTDIGRHATMIGWNATWWKSVTWKNDLQTYSFSGSLKIIFLVMSNRTDWYNGMLSIFPAFENIIVMKFGELNPRHMFIKDMITIRIQNKGSLPLFLVKSKRTYNRNEIPRIFPGKVVKAFKLVNVWKSHEIAQGYFRKHTYTHTYYSNSWQALMWGTWFNDHVI